MSSILNWKGGDLLDVSKVSLGFKTENLLQKLMANKKGITPSAPMVTALRKSAKGFVLTIVEKLLKKSPLNFDLVRNLEWAIPSKVSSDDCKFLFFIFFIFKILLN